MSNQHPTREVLELFVNGRLSATETQTVSRHILTGCAECRDVAAGMWQTGETPGDRPAAASASSLGKAATAEKPDSYDQVFDRVFRCIKEREAGAPREQAVARQLLEELMAQRVPARRLMIVANSSRFHNPLLCGLLIDESRTSGFEDPSQAIHSARLALAIAETLTEESCGGSEARDGLWCRAAAQLANALRVNNQHDEAQRTFLPVEELVREQGRIGLSDLAWVLDLRASLHRDFRQFDAASALLERVILIYQKLGQWNLLGRALLQRSAICGEVGDLETEMTLLRRSLDLLDPEEDPRTFLVARHNLIMALNQSGRSREAFALLFHTRPLYLRMGDRMTLLRLRWVEGAVALGLSRLEQAEVAFREVRDAYIELSLDYDAAVISLELASVYVRQGRAGDLRHLAQEMLVVFTTREIHREALQALSFFCGAARMEGVGMALVREISDFLKQARNNPDLRFVPPASHLC
jgi:tetratricopeptide (TPR) repeat protein